MSPPQVVFRTDASTWIGTGHVMRCATLAEGLRSAGAEVRFICRPLPGDCCGWLESQGFCVQRLTPAESPFAARPAGAPVHAPWLGVSMAQEQQESAAALALYGRCDWLVVDHYALDVTWERSMREYAGRILAIDDLADRHHECDLLLDQNLVADAGERYSGKVPPACGLMLGPEFALLHPSYAELHPRMRPRVGPVRTLMVFFGGADPGNMTGRALAALARLDRDDVLADVVVGASNPHREELIARAAGMPNIRLYDRLPSLAPLMARADLALGACGATVWERCCLGLPSLVVTVADNQKLIASGLHDRGFIRWLGDAGEVTEQTLAAAIRDVVSRDLPENWSRNCLELVDGSGRDRVITVLLASESMSLRLRTVRPADESLLLRWANDPEVRRNSLRPEPIDPQTHREWFQRRLSAVDACHIYIAESESGMPIGQVRFERSDRHWEIGYSLDRLFRGKALGRKLLEAALLRLGAEAPGGTVLGIVKSENLASRRIFEGLGFDLLDGQTGEVLRYSLRSA